MKTLALPAVLATPAPAPHRKTLEQALRIAGLKTLDQAAVRSYMEDQRRSSSDSFARRLLVAVLTSGTFEFLFCALAVLLVVAFCVSAVATLVLVAPLPWGAEWNPSISWCFGATVASGFTVALCAFFAAATDGLSARYAAWRTVPYKANNVPVWVRKIAGEARLRCPGSKFFVHELVQNQRVIDPVLEAVCPVTGRSSFLAVWGPKGKRVSLPEAT